MNTRTQNLFIAVVISILLGGGAGIISSTLTSRAIESYAAQLLNDQKLVSLIPRKSPELPGTFDEAMKKNREASLRSLAVILPARTVSTLPQGWSFPVGEQKLGVTVTNDGWVLTTSQGFPQKASPKDFEVYVDGQRFMIEKAVRDPRSALVLLKLVNAAGLSTVSFGKPEDVQSGSTIIGWGGEEELTPTLLAASDEDVASGPVNAESFLTTWRTVDVLAAGLPLFSSDAALLGFSSGDDLAFPLHHSGNFVQDVLKTGSPKMASLGATVADLSRVYDASAEVTAERSEGAYVVSVLPASAAQKAGLLVSDIITDVDGRAVTHTDTLSEILADYEPGEIANMHVLRKGAVVEFAVTLGEL